MTLRFIEIAGALLLLIAPFTPRYRRWEPPWMRVITVLAGVSVALRVGLSFYFDALRVTHDSQYSRLVPIRSEIGGVSIGFCASVLIFYCFDRDPKTRNA